MAGNIIPAIATTNAIIAGLIVMEALKILSNNFNKCSTVSLTVDLLNYCDVVLVIYLLTWFDGVDVWYNTRMFASLCT